MLSKEEAFSVQSIATEWVLKGEFSQRGKMSNATSQIHGILASAETAFHPGTTGSFVHTVGKVLSILQGTS